MLSNFNLEKELRRHNKNNNIISVKIYPPPADRILIIFDANEYIYELSILFNFQYHIEYIIIYEYQRDTYIFENNQDKNNNYIYKWPPVNTPTNEWEHNFMCNDSRFKFKPIINTVLNLRENTSFISDIINTPEYTNPINFIHYKMWGDDITYDELIEYADTHNGFV